MELIMIIQLMCSIQAFRGRNLPSLMNDGIILTYLSFALTILFVINFAIVTFRPIEEKEVFHCNTQMFGSLLILLLMYTQKAVRMVVHPNKNTSSYFRERTMRSILQTASQSIKLQQIKH